MIAGSFGLGQRRHLGTPEDELMGIKGVNIRAEVKERGREAMNCATK